MLQGDLRKALQVRRIGSQTPTRWLLTALSFAGGRTPRSVAILGNAAGTTARAFNTLFPATRLDPVEIDPELTSIGRRFFGLPRSVVVHHEDARRGARQSFSACPLALLVC